MTSWPERARGGKPPQEFGRGEIGRKLFHLCTPVFLVYYFVDPHLWIGLRKEVAVLIVLGIFLLGEAVRLWKGVLLPGMRTYEKQRVSAVTWGVLGLSIAFLLPFATSFVIASVLVMAWVDPLCAMTRRYGGYPILPLAGAFGILSPVLLFLGSVSIYSSVLLAGVGAVVAVGVEYPHVEFIDDDFLILMGTLLVLQKLAYILEYL